MSRKLQIKRGAKAALPALAPGELAMTTDEKTLYYGTGPENIPVARETHGHEAWQVGAVKRGDPVPFLSDRSGQPISFGAKLIGSNKYGSNHPRIEVLDDREKGADASILVPCPIYWDDAANKQYVDDENTAIAVPYYAYDANNSPVSQGSLLLSKQYLGSNRWSCFLSGAVIPNPGVPNIKKVVVSTGNKNITVYNSGNTVNCLALVDTGSGMSLRIKRMGGTFDYTLHELTLTVSDSENWMAIIISAHIGAVYET